MADKKPCQHKHRHRHESDFSKLKNQHIQIAWRNPRFTSQSVLHHIKKRFAPMVDGNRDLHAEIGAE